MDVDEIDDVQENLNVTSLPTIVCFKNKEEAARMFGTKAEKYESWFAE